MWLTTLSSGYGENQSCRRLIGRGRQVKDLKTPWSRRVSQCKQQFGDRRNEDIRKEMVEHLVDGAVLEVGAGTKELKKHLSCDYVGLDFTPEFDPDVLGNAENLPFSDDSFENVCTKNCLQHVEGWKRALNEIVRVASRRIVLAERVHNAPTKIILVNENDVIRRRFNASDLIRPLREFGEVKFNLSKADERVGVIRARSKEAD